MGVEFRVLGDVELRADGRLVDVGHARQRMVLVVFLVEPNHVVSADQLVDRVWGGRPPHRARETLYNYLSRLRQVLGPLTGVDLARQTGGYVLTADPMAVDLHRFERLVAAARAADDEGTAMTSFEQALTLWRGEPCAGLDTPWIGELRDALERDRFAVESDLADLKLRSGQHGWLLGELVARAAAHALDERVAGQLMLALYRCGRQAEALEHYQQLRVRLAEELGVDPGSELRRLYEQILGSDPALAVPARAFAATPASPVPRQLPAHTPHFVGRAEQLSQLTDLLDTSAGGGTVVITAINGTAGVGKTALALRWAHQATDRFPDGQLYVNLRGFDRTNSPVPPSDVLRGFLHAFGVPAEQIPASVDAQAALYRGLLTDKRVLVVLDNARDVEQVRPLFPASPSCAVVITSRNQLAGLVAQEGARLLTLDVLTLREARALLARHIGPDRVAAEPAVIENLIDHCARLPLALSIVAARTTTHPDFALGLVAKELADEQTRLDALDAGDPDSSVRAVFSWSYHHLSDPTARLFRLLGLHPGPDIGLRATAHLADLPWYETREALGELARAHLLSQHAPGRYSFHDLLRAYASHLTIAHDARPEQHAALTRLFDYYLHTAATAMDALHPTRNGQTDDPGAPPAADCTEARAWLETERANLTAIVAHTATHGWYTHTTRLANAVLLRYLEIGGLYREALAIYTHVRRAAHHTGDLATEALALTNLGTVHWQQGRCPAAIEHHEQAIVLSREIGFRLPEALALSSLGLVHFQQGRYQEAIEDLGQGLTLFRDIGERSGEVQALTHLGVVYWRQGRYAQAADHHRQAVAIAREIRFRRGEALALTNLGIVCWQQGHYQLATQHHQQALTIAREMSYHLGEVFALTHLGVVHWRQGRYAQAADHHRQAAAISREICLPLGELLALTNLGLVHGQQGSYQQAAEHHQRAAEIARDIDVPAGHALALAGLGITSSHQGRYQQATDQFEQALAICRDIGDRANEAQILNGLGETHHANAQNLQARTAHTAALALATEIGDSYEQARAHYGLAHTFDLVTEIDQVRHHGEQARSRYGDLGVADLPRDRTALAGPDPPS